ncbi:MAG: BrnA antitoxin family protein [Bdellovibrionales bacterium]
MKKQSKPLTNKAGDVRHITKADISRFRPAREVDPQLLDAYESGTLSVRGRPRGSSKTPVNLRLDNEVLAFFKNGGAGWQTRINKTLKAIVEASRENS